MRFSGLPCFAMVTWGDGLGLAWLAGCRGL
jgi:hypothetical protein